MWKKSRKGLSDGLIKETFKYGGNSLIIQGCITQNGLGYATRIDGRMDGDLYLTILKKELQQSLEFYDLDPSDIIFQ